MRSGHAICILCLSVLLAPVAIAATDNHIPDVIVTAPQPLQSTGQSTILTRDQINATGTSSLAQALKNLGSVQLQDMAGNGSQVMLSMRGFGGNASSNTLLLINGIPITNPDLMPPDLNAIPIQDIQQIEIIAGSESVLYGDQAVGGVINITTRETTDARLEAVCDAGSYALKHCYAGLSNTYRQLKYRLTADTTHTDNYRQHNDYQQNQLAGHFFYPYQQGELAFDFRAANETMQYPGALTARQVRENRQQASNNSDFFKDDNHFLQLKQKQLMSDNWTIETSFAQRGVNGHGVLFSPFTQSRSIYFLKPQLNGAIKQTKIKTGVELEQDHYQLVSTFGKTADRLHKYSLFGLTDIPIHPALIFNMGARGALQQNQLVSSTSQASINRALALTIGLTYHYRPDIQFYLRRAGSYRFPKADENTASVSGAEGLRTQRGVSYETGAQLDRQHYTAKLSLFQLNLRDEIAFDPLQTTQNPFGTNRNLPPTIRRGLSLSGKRRMNEKISLDAQLNLVNAHFQHGINTGNRIPLVADTTLRGGMQYKFNNHWDAYAETVFTGNQYPANDDANSGGIIGGYTLFNINLHYRLKALDVAFRVNNLFNKAYYFYTVFQTNPNTEFFYPAPERNVTLTIKYRFG